MLRSRIALPLLLSSLASAPALGAFNPSYCTVAPMSPVCVARAREFAQARNAEIDASLAAVKAARAREFAQARNAEINASLAAFERARASRLARTYCKTPDSTTPRCEAERAREFAQARNAEINASMLAYNAERGRAFTAHHNAEMRAAIAAMKAAKFAAARNAEITASMAAVQKVRARAFAAARNAEINASMAAVEKERARAFAMARNAEIDASMLAVKAQRALRLAIAARQSRLETGAISLPDTPLTMANNAPIVRMARHLGPCREAAHLMAPLRFANGSAEIAPAMKPELDRIAMMARTCPAIHIELHGYSDNAAPSQISRYLAQRRARAVAEYLVDAGVEKRRLATIGHADAQPVVPNTSAANRAINRRVEVTINDPAMQAAAQRVIWDLAELLDPTYVPRYARLGP